jgi:NAD(P)-dependent dehydrogenase (short-subunit alcohol dehydrogenase family)
MPISDRYRRHYSSLSLVRIVRVPHGLQAYSSRSCRRMSRRPPPYPPYALLIAVDLYQTGGASGIGGACIRLFAKRGVHVVIADIDKDAADLVLSDVAKLFPSTPSSILPSGIFVSTDVRSEDSIKNLVAQTIRTFDRIDYAVTCAGVTGPSTPCHDVDVADYRRTLDINVTGTFLSCKHFIRQMRSQDERQVRHNGPRLGLSSSIHS